MCLYVCSVHVPWDPYTRDSHGIVCMSGVCMCAVRMYVWGLGLGWRGWEGLDKGENFGEGK